MDLHGVLRKQVSALQIELYKRNQWKYLVDNNKTPPLFKTMIEYRMLDAFANGQSNLVATGDSIVHSGEYLIENPSLNKNRRIIDSGIGGDTLKTLHERVIKNVAIYRPQVVIIHCGGNDTLGGRPVELSLVDFKLMVSDLRRSGVTHIGYMEILPLGNPKDMPPRMQRKIDDVNFVAAPKLSKMIQETGLVDFIPLRKYLQGEDGRIRPECDSGDHIHINSTGFTTGFLPAMNDYLDSIGVAA